MWLVAIVLDTADLQSVSRIKINKVRCLFFSQIWQRVNWALFFEAAGAVVKIS